MTEEEIQQRIDLKGKIREIYSHYEGQPEEKIWLKFCEKYGSERTAKVLDPDKVEIQIDADICTFKCKSPKAKKELSQHEDFLKYLRKKYKNLNCEIRCQSFTELLDDLFKPFLTNLRL